MASYWANSWQRHGTPSEAKWRTPSVLSGCSQNNSSFVSTVCLRFASVLLLVASLLLVAMPGVSSSFLFLVVRPGAPSSVLCSFASVLLPFLVALPAPNSSR